MANDDPRDSDPLPYTQVDRSVKPKATLLARMINESPQHALGSLVEFWDLNGDPRDLEKRILEGSREIVLRGAEVADRFEAASGHALEPAKLVSLGLLERKGDDLFRVRGMSRYFDPIERRLQRRAAAVAGGKARAASGRDADGRFRPATGAGGAAGALAGVPAGQPAGVSAGRQLEGRLGDAPAGRQAKTTSAISDQRTADSVKRSRSTRSSRSNKKESAELPGPIAFAFLAMEEDRRAHCEGLGLQAGAREIISAGKKLELMLGARAVVDPGETMTDEDWPVEVQLSFRAYLADDFGQLDKRSGAPRVPPWPIALYLSPLVLQNYRERDEQE